MINLTNAWKEAFEANHPDTYLQVKGGGSGVGIAGGATLGISCGAFAMVKGSGGAKPARSSPRRWTSGSGAAGGGVWSTWRIGGPSPSLGVGRTGRPGGVTAGKD